MRFVDLLRMALSGLAQHKVRTLLTTAGVACGAFVLIFSLSLGQGVQETIEREYLRYGELRRIEVYPNWRPPSAEPPPENPKLKTVSRARRDRLRRELRERASETAAQEPIYLTPERLDAIAKLEHVVSVQPILQIHGKASYGDKSCFATALAITPDNEHYRERLSAGRTLQSPNERAALVTEYLLYQLDVVKEEEIQAVLGQKLHFEQQRRETSPVLLLGLLGRSAENVGPRERKALQRALERLPQDLHALELSAEDGMTLQKLFERTKRQDVPTTVALSEDLTIVGVVRSMDESESTKRRQRYYKHSDVIIPNGLGNEILAKSSHQGFDRAFVEVSSVDHVKTVSAKVSEQGLQARALLDAIEREQFSYRLIFAAMQVVAMIALVVAAIGITNTLFMSVLERYREIGILKAVGATPRDVCRAFLLEGVWIGAAGSALGALLAWTASFPADRWVRAMVEQKMSVTLQESVLVFPWWLMLGAPVFVCAVTTFAAYLPARKAARVNPVIALRHD